jgi:hypothetical protein
MVMQLERTAADLLGSWFEWLPREHDRKKPNRALPAGLRYR